MDGVSFSASGSRLAWVSHDSNVSIADASKSVQVSTPKTKFLPLLSVLHLREQLATAAAHCSVTTLPWLFDLGVKLDVPKQEHTAQYVCYRPPHQHGQEAHNQELCNSTAPEMLHQNRITLVSNYEMDKQDCHQFCTLWSHANLGFQEPRVFHPRPLGNERLSEPLPSSMRSRAEHTLPFAWW